MDEVFESYYKEHPELLTEHYQKTKLHVTWAGGSDYLHKDEMTAFVMWFETKYPDKIWRGKDAN